MKALPDLLAGAVDLHVHSSPDIDPRRFDDIALAREAAKAGMRAVLIKSHQNSTVERASLVSKIVPGIGVFGGLVLNDTVGGLNPDAVDVAIRLGAKQIWMPTRSARNHRRYHAEPGGLSIVEENGEIRKSVVRILELIAAGKCILGTGHLSPEEAVLLIRSARKAGISKILVTHPEWAATFYPVELQLELASMGVYFERCFVSTTHRGGFTSFSTILDAVKQVGAASTVLATDLGQPDTPEPADGLRIFAERALSEGFSHADVRRMLVSNPASLLGLSGEG